MRKFVAGLSRESNQQLVMFSCRPVCSLLNEIVS